MTALYLFQLVEVKVQALSAYTTRKIHTPEIPFLRHPKFQTTETTINEFAAPKTMRTNLRQVSEQLENVATFAQD